MPSLGGPAYDPYMYYPVPQSRAQAPSASNQRQGPLYHLMGGHGVVFCNAPYSVHQHYGYVRDVREAAATIIGVNGVVRARLNPSIGYSCVSEQVADAVGLPRQRLSGGGALLSSGEIVSVDVITSPVTIQLLASPDQAAISYTPEILLCISDPTSAWDLQLGWDFISRHSDMNLTPPMHHITVKQPVHGYHHGQEQQYHYTQVPFIAPEPGVPLSTSTFTLANDTYQEACAIAWQADAYRRQQQQQEWQFEVQQREWQLEQQRQQWQEEREQLKQQQEQLQQLEDQLRQQLDELQQLSRLQQQHQQQLAQLRLQWQQQVQVLQQQREEQLNSLEYQMLQRRQRLEQEQQQQWQELEEEWQQQVEGVEQHHQQSLHELDQQWSKQLQQHQSRLEALRQSVCSPRTPQPHQQHQGFGAPDIVDSPGQQHQLAPVPATLWQQQQAGQEQQEEEDSPLNELTTDSLPGAADVAHGPLEAGLHYPMQAVQRPAVQQLHQQCRQPQQQQQQQQQQQPLKHLIGNEPMTFMRSAEDVHDRYPCGVTPESAAILRSTSSSRKCPSRHVVRARFNPSSYTSITQAVADALGLKRVPLTSGRAHPVSGPDVRLEVLVDPLEVSLVRDYDDVALTWTAPLVFVVPATWWELQLGDDFCTAFDVRRHPGIAGALVAHESTAAVAANESDDSNLADYTIIPYIAPRSDHEPVFGSSTFTIAEETLLEALAVLAGRAPAQAAAAILDAAGGAAAVRSQRQPSSSSGSRSNSSNGGSVSVSSSGSSSGSSNSSVMEVGRQDLPVGAPLHHQQQQLQGPQHQSHSTEQQCPMQQQQRQLAAMAQERPQQQHPQPAAVTSAAVPLTSKPQQQDLDFQHQSAAEHQLEQQQEDNLLQEVSFSSLPTITLEECLEEQHQQQYQRLQDLEEIRMLNRTGEQELQRQRQEAQHMRGPRQHPEEPLQHLLRGSEVHFLYTLRDITERYTPGHLKESAAEIASSNSSSKRVVRVRFNPTCHGSFITEAVADALGLARVRLGGEGARSFLAPDGKATPLEILVDPLEISLMRDHDDVALTWTALLVFVVPNANNFWEMQLGMDFCGTCGLEMGGMVPGTSIFRPPGAVTDLPQPIIIPYIAPKPYQKQQSGTSSFTVAEETWQEAMDLVVARPRVRARRAAAAAAAAAVAAIPGGTAGSEGSIGVAANSQSSSSGSSSGSSNVMQAGTATADGGASEQQQQQQQQQPSEAPAAVSRAAEHLLSAVGQPASVPPPPAAAAAGTSNSTAPAHGTPEWVDEWAPVTTRSNRQHQQRGRRHGQRRGGHGAGGRDQASRSSSSNRGLKPSQ